MRPNGSQRGKETCLVRSHSDSLLPKERLSVAAFGKSEVSVRAPANERIYGHVENIALLLFFDPGRQPLAKNPANS